MIHIGGRHVRHEIHHELYLDASVDRSPWQVQRITFEAWEGDRSFGLLCRRWVDEIHVDLTESAGAFDVLWLEDVFFFMFFFSIEIGKTDD